MVWVQIPSREEQNLTALKSNSNTVWFNVQTYIYIYIYSYSYYSGISFEAVNADFDLKGCIKPNLFRISSRRVC